MNVVLISLFAITTIASVYAVLSPRYSLPVFFVWAGLADLFKRLLWLQRGPSPTTTEYGLVLLLPDLILLAGVARVAWDLWITQSIEYTFHWMDIPAGMYFLWALIGVFNPEKTLLVGMIGFKSCQLYVLVYFLVRLYPDSIQLLANLKYSLLAIGLFTALYGLYQIFFGFTVFELRWLASGFSMLGSFKPHGMSGNTAYGDTIALHNIIRIFSTFASHEQFGFFLASIGILIFALPMKNRSRFVFAIPICLALMRTLSRSSWAFASAGIVVLLAGTIYLRDRPRMVYPIALICLMTGGYFFWNFYTARIVSNATQDFLNAPLIPDSPDAFAVRASTFETFEWREYTVRALIADPKWHSLFGNGTGSMWYAWRLERPDTVMPTRDEIREQGIIVPGKRVLSHIGTVDTIYELGISGLLMFLWIIGSAIWFAFRFILNPGSSEEKVIVLTGTAIVLGIFAVNSTIATVLIFRPVAVFFWLALGLIASICRGERPAPKVM